MMVSIESQNWPFGESKNIEPICSDYKRTESLSTRSRALSSFPASKTAAKSFNVTLSCENESRYSERKRDEFLAKICVFPVTFSTSMVVFWSYHLSTKFSVVIFKIIAHKFSPSQQICCTFLSKGNIGSH